MNALTTLGRWLWRVLIAVALSFTGIFTVLVGEPLLWSAVALELMLWAWAEIQFQQGDALREREKAVRAQAAKNAARLRDRER